MDTSLATKTDLKWVRAEDGIIGGVCLQLARQVNLDPWLVRAVWLMTVCVFGSGLLAYVALVIALPRTDRLDKSNEKMVLGVCARLSQRGDLEVGLARLIALLLLLISCGAVIFGYFVLHFLLPTKMPGSAQTPNKSLF
ncbi:MAG: PspC domain-containing protein [Bdellovibrionaceae bacterium]|nr:PspC domain-containing protein [Pseudobdellovibrionaceae bacterium]